MIGPRTLVAALCLTATASCGDASSGAIGTKSAGGSVITVLAAASLTESFTRIGRDFEATHSGATVTFSFGGSSQLARQITAGAPADVFAAADPATMRTVTDTGAASGAAQIFVRNQLVIAVPTGNPAGVKTLAHLSRPGLKVALCAEQVPCGAAARRVLATVGVTLTPVTLEQDVRAAMAKVRLGEVDAALVYRTDVRAAAGEVDGVEFPESAAAVNDYPIVALANARDPAAADAFVAYVLGAQASTVFTAAGFQRP